MRPRLLTSFAFGILTLLVLSPIFVDQRVTRALIAWNAGTALYIVLIVVMMVRSSYEGMQRRAEREDEGQYVVLGLVVLTVDGDRIAAIDRFVDNSALPGFGLPRTLPAD